ncbi:hypothetical protein [Streptomyces antimycoticus]|uniref:hypothetical protein n=1 Tax=Streptomyces antimycoticus TaxID=68175 RepID=UPI0036884C8B
MLVPDGFLASDDTSVGPLQAGQGETVTVIWPEAPGPVRTRIVPRSPAGTAVGQTAAAP